MRKRNLIIVAVLAVALAGAFLALREPDPQAVLRRAQAKLASEKTMHVDLFASFLGAPRDLAAGAASDATGVDIELHADLDRAQPADPASVSAFSIIQEIAGASQRLSGQARRKDGKYYLHLESAQGFDQDLAKRLIGIWASSDRPFTDLLMPPSQEALGEHPLDEAGIQAMRQAIGAVDLFKVDKKLPSEKIDDQDTYHYAVETNMQAVSALLIKLRELRSPAPLGSADILAVTDEIVPWGKPIGEAWIGKRDGRVLRIKLETQFSVSPGAPPAGAIAQMDFSRYGQPVSVEAPQAQDLQTLLGPSFSKQLSLAGERQASAAPATGATSTAGLPTAPAFAPGAMDSDGDGLSDSQEFFYGTDAWSPDTDGDGYPDGLEVEKGMNPLGPGTLFGFGL